MASFLLDEDAALKAKLQGLTVNDLNNATRPVEVYFREPQKEVREQAYPYITIDLTGIMRDPQREGRGYIDPYGLYNIPGYTVDGNANTKARTLTPTPVNLLYNVRVFSRNPLHDRQLQWLLLAEDRLPFRFGFLEVGPVDGGSIRRLDLLSVTPADYKDSQGLAVFRKVYTVSVSSEMLSTRVRQIQQALSVSLEMRGHTPLADASAPLTSAQPVYTTETITITQ